MAAPGIYTLEQAEEDIARLRGQVDALSEILALQESGLVPNTLAGAAQLYADPGAAPAAIYGSGLQMNLQGAELATFPGTVVTAAALTTLATATIPASDAEAGATYELECEGNWTQATTTAVTMQFATALGGTSDTNQIIGTTGFTAGGTGRFWARARCYCVTTGSGGTWRTSIRAVMTPNANPNNTVSIVDADASGTIAVSTIAAQALVVQFKWGSTAGTPSITNRVQVFKRVA